MKHKKTSLSFEENGLKGYSWNSGAYCDGNEIFHKNIRLYAHVLSKMLKTDLYLNFKIDNNDFENWVFIDTDYNGYLV